MVGILQRTRLHAGAARERSTEVDGCPATANRTRWKLSTGASRTCAECQVRVFLALENERNLVSLASITEFPGAKPPSSNGISKRAADSLALAPPIALRFLHGDRGGPKPCPCGLILTITS